MTNWTQEEGRAINKFLTYCVQRSYKCSHCANNHNGICFFAAGCFLNDFNLYNEEEEPDETFEPGRPYWNEMEANP